jgi:hypothetical protein
LRASTKLGVEGLLRDAPGRGHRPSLDGEADLLDAEGKPVSLRRAAAHLGVSSSALWRALKKVQR